MRITLLGRSKPGGLVILAALAMVLVAGCSRRGPSTAMVDSPGPANVPRLPLHQTSGHQAIVSLPTGSLLLRPAEAEVVAPFGRAGEVIELLEGNGTVALAGAIRYQLMPTISGPHRLWVRVRWNDACGNSLTLKTAGQPEAILGEDAIYGAWHWLRGADLDLIAGQAMALELREREDGVAVSEALLTPDLDFRPSGRLGEAKSEMPEPRRLADDFNRSPGHGLDGWRAEGGTWGIRFSFDPNRIPYQYSLDASATDREGLLAAAGAPWNGCTWRFNLNPLTPGEYGAAFRDGNGQSIALRFVLRDAGGALHVDGPGLQANVPADFRRGQWHAVRAERWGPVLRVFLDGQPLWQTHRLPSDPFTPLLTCRGTAVFDDVAATEIRWAMDGAGRQELSWAPRDGAAWYRLGQSSGACLEAESGTVDVGFADLPVSTCLVVPTSPDAEPLIIPGQGNRAALAADALPTKLAAVYVCSIAEDAAPPYLIGPYHFSSQHLIDPGDYHDFTEEEATYMQRADQRDKLQREPRLFPVVGRGTSDCAWSMRGGRWRVRDGVLAAEAPGDLLHAQALGMRLTFSGRLRLASAESAVEWAFYAGDGQEAVIRLAPTPEADGCLLALPIPADGAWHALSVTFDADTITAQVDGEAPVQADYQRGLGEQLLLRLLRGTAEFDDLCLAVPRRQDAGGYYAFDRRETDWWREGEWIDHAGIACVIASSWVSLVAPSERGMLWYKHRLGANLAVAFNLEEFSEWYGWSANPSHTHFPYHHVLVALTGDDASPPAYEIELNAEEGRTFILRRRGVELQRTAQTAPFPMRFQGGHAPYRPRANRVQVIRQGATLRCFINGNEVLTYTDPDPLPVERLGFGGHDTRINFTGIEVRRLEADLLNASR